MQILRAFRDPSQLAEVQILLAKKKKKPRKKKEMAQEMGLLPTDSVSRDHECWLAARAVGEFQW